MNTEFYSNGKILLSGEYVVLDGAKAIAFPTTYGQRLEVKSRHDQTIKWKSYAHDGTLWFDGSLTTSEIANSNFKAADELLTRIHQILRAAQLLNPEFLRTSNGYTVTSRLDFPKNWGLGSSSTLVNNIAQWAGIDAYALLNLSFKGSGYDIAAAQHNTPISYQIINDFKTIEPIEFAPNFINQLYLIHLNKKQNSRTGINLYQTNKPNYATLASYIKAISELSDALIKAKHLEAFSALLTKHETLIAELTHQQPIKEALFPDFKGAIKSLGAWGGDFILAATNSNPKHYFESKGYSTVLPFSSVVL